MIDKVYVTFLSDVTFPSDVTFSSVIYTFLFWEIEKQIIPKRKITVRRKRK